MNRLSLIGAIGVISALVPAFASAQSTPFTSTGVEIHGGVFFPVNSNARSNATAWLAYGASYRLLRLSDTPGQRESISVSADYYGQSGWSQAPILLNWNAGAGPVFFSAGAGMGFAHEPSSTGTDFAYQGTIGYNFPTTSNIDAYVMARWWGSDRTELDGAGVYVGIRF